MRLRFGAGRRLWPRAERRLAEEAPKYDGCYRLFGSVVRDEVHARSDLDLLAEFPKVTIGKAIRGRGGDMSGVGIAL